MIRPWRKSLCGPSTDPKPPGSHRFPESNTRQLIPDVRISLIFEGQYLCFSA